MWDKDHDHKMDDEKIAKWTKIVAEFGIPEDKIDERVLWIFNKVSHKLKMIRLILDEKGVDEAEAKQIIEKLVAKVNEKDLSKIKEWHQKHQEK
jgi:hypothetical protein